MNRSSLTAVCYWWLWFFGCHAPVPSLCAATGVLLHRRPVDPPQASPFSRSRPVASSLQQKKSAAAAAADGQDVGDQDSADTVGINFGVGFGFDTPLIDSLLERLLRRKQFLQLAAAAAAAGWGSSGAGFYANPVAAAAVFPYAGGVFGGAVGGGGVFGGNGGSPWNRPAAYPYPTFVPPAVNPYGGGGGSWTGGPFGGPFGGGGGGGGGSGGGFNQLFDFDNDFVWRNNNGN